MAGSGGDVREHVLREIQGEIRDLAGAGLTAGEIDQRVCGDRDLSGAERDVAYLVTYHAVAEAKGRY
jgi:hypothetical protein